MLLQSKKNLGTYVANIITTFPRLYHSLDTLVRAHEFFSIATFVETKGKNVIR